MKTSRPEPSSPALFRARRRSGTASSASLQPRGFTLVEMLVAVALVLLMMVLFAQVFKQASDSMTRMKGMAENDQKARQLTIMLRGDLSNRTFRDIKPFAPGQDTSLLSSLEDPAVGRRGYFSISENDPSSSLDDVLQFTIQIPSSELPLSGRSVLLKQPGDTLNSDGTIDLGSTTMTVEHISLDNYLQIYRNQPEFDDGQTNVNFAGSSTSAEVCYYVRNGNLYRRVLLIRKAYNGTGNPDPLTGNYGSNQTANGTGYFWRDFDYSAFHRPSPDGVEFHTLDSLSNSSSTTVLSGIPFPKSLGLPHMRFGSTLYRNDGTTVSSGFPREFLNPADATTFIGRFHQQEVADGNFGYPGWIPGGGDPHDYATPGLSVDSATGLVSPYHDEIYRRGEDIMLNNVYEFDIKVWDDHGSVRDFVDLGHNREADNGSGTMVPVGHYNDASRINLTFGDWRDNRYDTWHPRLYYTSTPPAPAPPPTGRPAMATDTSRSWPPYRPVSNGPDGVPGSAGDDDAANGAEDNGELGWIGTDDEIPLRAIQITIRYFDVSSNQMRQLTLVQSVLR